MGFIGGTVGVGILTYLSPNGENHNLDGAAYRNKSKLEVLFGLDFFDQIRGKTVIDFGCAGVGDPACDVMAAWLFLSAETRAIFREALRVDDDTWARGRGWALSMGLIALPYYRTTNPVLAGIARRAILEAVTDSES